MKTLLVMILFLPFSAQAGDKVLNGGDACERRFLEIRDDLSQWLGNHGHEQLRFPSGITPVGYKAGMKNAFESAHISCVDEKLAVLGAEKTCVNFKNQDGTPQIVCQNERFLKLPTDEQYRLTHHEYAGVAGLEGNREEESSYPISNQISAFLDIQTSKRLVVKDLAGSDIALDRAFGNFLGKYTVTACAATGDYEFADHEFGDLCQVEELSVKKGWAVEKGPADALVIFEKTKVPQPVIGIVLGRSACQLGYGTAYCTPQSFPGAKNFATTRIEAVNASVYLDFNIEPADQSGSVRKWSLVLKRLN